MHIDCSQNSKVFWFAKYKLSKECKPEAATASSVFLPDETCNLCVLFPRIKYEQLCVCEYKVGKSSETILQLLSVTLYLDSSQ